MFVEASLDLFWGFIATRSQIGVERWYNYEDKLMGPNRRSNKNKQKAKKKKNKPYSKAFFKRCKKINKRLSLKTCEHLH